MKKAQKAMKLSLFGLAALIALVNATALKAENSADALQVAAVVVEAQKAEKTPEQMAAEIFEPFFTDKNYQVTESFRTMCCKAVPHLKQSKHKVLHDLAAELEKLCQNSGTTAKQVGDVLSKYKDKLAQLFESENKSGTKKPILPTITLFTRLTQALRIK